MMSYVGVLLGGAIGSLLRFMVANAVQRTSVGNFPAGTLTVNLAGCLVIGFLWALAEKMNFSPLIRIFFFAGVLGGFTTFSSFGLEALQLMRSGEWKMLITYVLLSNVLGIGLAALGYAAGKMVGICGQ